MSELVGCSTDNTGSSGAEGTAIMLVVAPGLVRAGNGDSSCISVNWTDQSAQNGNTNSIGISSSNSSAVKEGKGRHKRLSNRGVNKWGIV